MRGRKTGRAEGWESHPEEVFCQVSGEQLLQSATLL